MNLNPFSKKVDLSNPFQVYQDLISLTIQPIMFVGKKEFVKELSSLLGPKFENCITNLPMINLPNKNWESYEELMQVIVKNTNNWRGIPNVRFVVIGEKFNKLLKDPKEFKSFSVEVGVTFHSDNPPYQLYFGTLCGYYEAVRKEGETKPPVKSLPITCHAGCGKHFFPENDCDHFDEDEDSPSDSKAYLDIEGCCSDCGKFYTKPDYKILSKAFLYVRETEKKLGINIFPTD